MGKITSIWPKAGAAAGAHQLAFLLAGHQRDLDVASVQRDEGGILGMQQIVRGVVDVPLALFVDADQHGFVAFLV